VKDRSQVAARGPAREDFRASTPGDQIQLRERRERFAKFLAGLPAFTGERIKIESTSSLKRQQGTPRKLGQPMGIVR